MSLALEGGFLTNHWTTREVPILIFEGFFFFQTVLKVLSHYLLSSIISAENSAVI